MHCGLERLEVAPGPVHGVVESIQVLGGVALGRGRPPIGHAGPPLQVTHLVVLGPRPARGSAQAQALVGPPGQGPVGLGEASP